MLDWGKFARWLVIATPAWGLVFALAWVVWCWPWHVMGAFTVVCGAVVLYGEWWMRAGVRSGIVKRGQGRGQSRAHRERN